MKRVTQLAFMLFALGLSAATRAELTIEITQGVDNPTPIAVVPFAWQSGGAGSADIASVVDGDLNRSGQFAPVRRADMLGLPSTEAEIFYRDWRAINTEYVLIGRVSQAG